MQTVLKERLWAYIVHNHPDLLFELQENNLVAAYLQEKITGILPIMERMLTDGNNVYEVEAHCLNLMTEDLEPSKYSYIRSVLEEEFPRDYQRLSKTGTLVYEVLNMLEACRSVFEDFGFDAKALGNTKLRHAVIACIHDSLIN